MQELQRRCSPLIDHLECVQSYDLACSGRSEYIGISPPLYYHRLKSILDDVCDESTSLYRDLGRSLPCIRSRVSRNGTICFSSKERVLDAYRNYLISNPSKRKGGCQEMQERQECLSLIATVACMMDDIERKCGFLASEAAKNIARRSQIFADDCGLDIFQELKGIIDDLNLDLSVKRELRQYFVVEIE